MLAFASKVHCFSVAVMAAQTTTIETVTVARPLKIISLVCLFIALITLVIALATRSWLKTAGFYTGLFMECSDDSANSHSPIPGAPYKGACQRITRDASYITAVAVLLFIALFATLLAFIGNVLGLKSNDLHRKHIFYKFATYICFFTVLVELVALIIFPAFFFVRMNDYGVRTWEFDWSYGVAWGATLFTFGATLLLICDKEHEEIYYKEKTIYNPPTEFA